MAITVPSTASIAGDKTAAASKQFTLARAPATVDEIIVVNVAWQGSVSGQTMSVSVLSGVGYDVAILGQRQASGKAGIISILVTLSKGSVVTLPSNGATITITASTGNIVAWGGHYISIKTGAPEIGVAVVGADSAATTSAAPTATSGSIPSGGIVIGCMGLSGPTGDTFTQDTDTTNGSWVTAGGATPGGTSGGSATTNETVRGAYKIVTAAGAQTYNPTLGTARNYAELIFGILPVTPVSATDVNGTVTDGAKIGLRGSENPTGTPADTGTKNPDSANDLSGVWVNPNNAVGIDGFMATRSITSASAQGILQFMISAATLGLPAGVTITDIGVSTVYGAGSGAANETLVRLVRVADSTETGTNRAANDSISGGATISHSGDPIVDWGLSAAERDAILTLGIGVDIAVTTSLGSSQAVEVDGLIFDILYTIPGSNVTESASKTIGGGSTPISGTDSGTDSESATMSTISQDGDSIVSPVEVAAITARPITTDANSTTTESASVVSVTPVSGTDTATVSAENTNLAAKPNATDANGTTTEATTQTAQASAVDAGSDSEATQLSILTPGDSGTASDSQSVTQPPTPISGTDANGATAEATRIAETAPDTASATETSTQVEIATVTDSATDNEQATPVIRVPDNNGATTETATISTPLTASDANGATTETGVPNAVSSAADAASAAELTSQVEIATTTDTNSVTTENASPNMRVADTNNTTTETASISTPLSSSDTNGATIESATPIKQTADAASDTEAFVLAAKPNGTDTGTVSAENTILKFSASDNNGTTTESASITVPVSGSDVNSATTEAGAVRVFITASDVATSAEAAQIIARVTAAENGTETETNTVRVITSATDAATAAEATRLALASTDQGSISELETLIQNYISGDSATVIEDQAIVISTVGIPTGDHTLTSAEIVQAVLAKAGVVGGELLGAMISPDRAVLTGAGIDGDLPSTAGRPSQGRLTGAK